MAIIDLQDKRAWVAAVKIWDYAREHSQRLSSQEPIRQITKAVEVATAKERRLYEDALKEIAKYKWMISHMQKASYLNKKGEHNRVKDHDKEIKRAYCQLGVSAENIAVAFRTSKTVIVRVLQEQNVEVKGEY